MERRVGACILACGLLAEISYASPDPTPEPRSRLPACPLEMMRRFAGLVNKYAVRNEASVGAAYVGPRVGVADECAMEYTSPGPSGACRGNCSRDAFPMGSFTKMWTASAVMKLREEGAIDIDAPAFPLLEGAYHRDDLVKHFGEDIRNVTPRQLMGMRGSIADFDEFNYQRWYPLRDLGPAQIVEMYGNSTGQPVGTCGAYSSMSYTLLGLLLINASGAGGAEPWSNYSQNVWAQQFPDVTFGVHGPCKDYTDVRGPYKGHDASEMSCTAGYSCGNMIAPPLSAALFVKDLLQGRLLKPESVAEMRRYIPLGEAGASAGSVPGACDSGRLSWGSGAPYGLGVMGDPVKLGSSRVPGHRGSTYGYTAVATFDTESRAAISVSMAGMHNTAKLSLWRDIHEAFLQQWPLPGSRRRRRRRTTTSPVIV